jgi:hypothetical protein
LIADSVSLPEPLLAARCFHTPLVEVFKLIAATKNVLYKWASVNSSVPPASSAETDRKTKAIPMTVIDYVLSRLRQIGVADIFGVPGDFSFPINDAICLSEEMRWIGCSNELNAAYAADGYARVRGVGAVCTTYGVGELSAINGIAGSYAEHLPVFHLVGMPNQAPRKPARLCTTPLATVPTNSSIR